jgi:hypothetical protein
MADVAYIAARTVLLDALKALGSQCDAIIIVGAQAIYLRTGDGGITGYAPFTTDADLVLAPSRLANEPLIEELMGDADFEQKGDPGIWWKTLHIEGTTTDVEVDLRAHRLTDCAIV